MENDTYEYYFKSVITPSVLAIENSLIKKYGAAKKYGLTKRDLDSCKQPIFDDYISIRDDLKKQFFKLDEKKENLIDIHKIASCFCKSMLENKIFIFELKEDIPTEVMLCNYTLALSASLGILYLNLLGTYKKEQRMAEYKFLKKQRKFFLPLTNDGHDKYFNGRVKTLALNDIYSVTFDLLTFADMMFWIEEYNKSVVTAKIRSKRG